MTAKEKAEELVNKFWDNAIPEAIENDKKVGIKCAIICVDEILNLDKIKPDINSNYDYYYWQKVKQEIEKL